MMAANNMIRFYNLLRCNSFTALNSRVSRLMSTRSLRSGCIVQCWHSKEASITQHAGLSQSLSSSFHTSQPVLLARRRQRGGEGGDKSSPVTDAKDFADAADALLEKVYNALLPMKELNDPFDLTFGYDQEKGPNLKLNVGPVKGVYTIQVDYDEALVFFITPISGQIAYFFSHAQEWRSTSDGHLFEGLLVRDLNRQCAGLPKI